MSLLNDEEKILDYDSMHGNELLFNIKKAYKEEMKIKRIKILNKLFEKLF